MTRSFKRILLVSLALILVALPALGMAADKVTLRMGSWRMDDVDEVNAMLAEYAKVAPDVEIVFDPTNPPDYNAILRQQLDGGAGPDLMYARSYATGLDLFQSGYFADITDLPGLKENYTADAVAPWTTEDGKTYALPFIAVSHAVYYNKAIFEKEGLSVPATFEDFVALCETLKGKGYTPLGNGLADQWDVLETFFLGMLPNYIGGSAERIKYENGEKPLNDEAMVAAYADIAKLAPYLPEGFAAVDYNSMQALFNTEQAVMVVDGSWNISAYAAAPFEWSVFTVPPPAGKTPGVCFHIDAAMAANPKSANLEAAKAFLAWMATKEGAQVVAANLPAGMFPTINADIQLADVHSAEFLGLNEGKTMDVRFVWPKMMDLYAPMNEAVVSVLKGEKTPQEAADAVAAVWAAK